VASDSYALTLWTFLQSAEAERLDSLMREHESLMLADMIRVGFHEPNKLVRFEADWRRRAFTNVEHQESIEEMSRRADEMWIQHDKAKRPVS
jgi:hypothetical protein